MSLQPNALNDCYLHIERIMVDTDSTTNNTNMSEKVEKRKLTPEEFFQLKDKLLEIKQIDYEEQLVYERLKHLNSEKQYLQDLLNALHTMDDNDRMKNSRSHKRLPQKIDSS